MRDERPENRAKAFRNGANHIVQAIGLTPPGRSVRSRVWDWDVHHARDTEQPIPGERVKKSGQGKHRRQHAGAKGRLQEKAKRSARSVDAGRGEGAGGEAGGSECPPSREGEGGAGDVKAAGEPDETGRARRGGSTDGWAPPRRAAPQPLKATTPEAQARQRRQGKAKKPERRQPTPEPTGCHHHRTPRPRRSGRPRS